MGNITAFEYNGQSIFRREDGFINLTQMCRANGKKLDNYFRLKQTVKYIDVLSRSLTSEVTDTIQGGIPSQQGTWGHPTLAINLARWISPDFAVWCDSVIFDLMDQNKLPTSKREPLDVFNDMQYLNEIFDNTYQDSMVVAELKLMVVTRSLSEIMDVVRSYMIHKQWSWTLDRFVDILNKDPLRKESILYQLEEKIMMGEFIPSSGMEPLPTSTLWQRELRKEEGYED